METRNEVYTYIWNSVWLDKNCGIWVGSYACSTGTSCLEYNNGTSTIMWWCTSAQYRCFKGTTSVCKYACN
jgi:hypothetical protein